MDVMHAQQPSSGNPNMPPSKPLMIPVPGMTPSSLPQADISKLPGPYQTPTGSYFAPSIGEALIGIPGQGVSSVGVSPGLANISASRMIPVSGSTPMGSGVTVAGTESAGCFKAPQGVQLETEWLVPDTC
jgi:hypothetical protein